MKSILIPFSIILFLFSIQLNAQDMNWAIQFASETGIINSASGYAIKVNSENDILVAGNYFGTVDFDPSASVQNLNADGARSNFIVKLNENGSLIWANQLYSPSGNDDIVFDLDESDNFYVAGKFREETDFDFGSGIMNLSTNEGEFYVAKYNTDAELIWVVRLGKKNWPMKITDIDIDVNGDAFVVGSFESNIKLTDATDTYFLNSNGENDGFVTKIDGDTGLFQWHKSFGGTDNELLSAVETDAESNIFLTGVFYGTTDLNR